MELLVTMSTLSGIQPWWWAITHKKHAPKRVGNRTRCLTRSPREVLLHASGKAVDLREFVLVEHQLLKLGLVEPGEMGHALRSGQMQCGGIVGRAKIVDVVDPHTSSERLARYHDPTVDWRWWMQDQFGHVLEDVIALEFTPCKGKQGLWKYTGPMPKPLAA